MCVFGSCVCEFLCVCGWLVRVCGMNVWSGFLRVCVFVVHFCEVWCVYGVCGVCVCV